MTTTQTRPWEWRIGLNHGFWDVAGRPTFHAHDVNDLSACEPSHGLVRTSEQPNEGSFFCPACLDATKAMPEGRARRVYAAEDGGQADG